jgi:anti-anti-sigma factor
MDDGSDGSTVTTAGGRALVELRGDVDVMTVPALRDEAFGVLEPPIEEVRVDLSRCTFLDSAGIALLGVLWGRARDLGARFVLSHPQTNVRVVLTIAGLSGLIGEDGGQPAEVTP